MVTGLVGGGLTLGLTVAEAKGGWIAPLHQFPSSMAQNFWIAIISWSACFFVTVLVTLVTNPRPESELHNLVYGVTDLPREEGAPWYKRPGPLAVIVVIVLVIMNIIYW
jgi:SSS family solute:Na+ symporter